MGEWSKKVGEIGEEIVSELLTKIGWGQHQKGIKIDCSNPKQHKLTDRDRDTHGVDFLFTTRSPLIDERLVHLVISSKYTSKEYPGKTTAVSTFKKHISDLTQTVHCFRRSSTKQEQEKSQSGIRSAEIVGVLFWLTANPSDDIGVIDKIAAAEIDPNYKFESICVVDNRIAAFLYDSIEHLKAIHKDRSVEFYYFSTGKNLNGKERRISGVALPFQYINSDMLPFRIESSEPKTNILALCLNAPFSSDNMSRMLAMAQALCTGWAGSIELYFNKYDSQTDDNIAKAVAGSFSEGKITGNLTVTTFRPDFRSRP